MGKQFIRIWRNIETGELSEYKEEYKGKYNYEPTQLVYEIDTRVIFYKFSEIVTVFSKNFEDQIPMDSKVGFMSQYISKNGKYCRFINNKIVEIG